VRLESILIGVSVAGALTCGAAGAMAQEKESDYPLSYVERPIVVPPMTIAPSASVFVDHFSVGLGTGNTGAGLEIGAKFGVIENLEIHAIIAPIHLAPHPVEYEPPTIGATYRFLKGDFEMGGQVDFTLGFVNSDFVEEEPATEFGGTNFGVRPGVPARLHIGREAALDFGVFFPITFHKTTTEVNVGAGRTLEVDNGLPATTVGLEIPIAVSYDIIEPLHIGVKTGLNDLDFGHFGDDFYVPLGVFAGYAVGDKKPILDIDPFFQWNYFLVPGTPKGEDKVFPGIWQLGVEITGYFYL
jgi:hypothetical protein